MGMIADGWGRLAELLGFGSETTAEAEPEGFSVKSCGPGVITFTAAEIELVCGAEGEFPTPFMGRMDPEGMLSSSTVMACVSALTFATQEMRLRVLDRRSRSKVDHPLERAFRAPTLGFERIFRDPGKYVEMSAGDMLVRIMTFAAIGGVAYLEKIITGRRLAGFQVHHRYEAERDPTTGRVIGVQRPDGTWEPVEHRDIIALKWPVAHPTDPHIGLAPAEALLREVGMDRSASAYMASLLRDDGIPFQALKLPPGSQLDPERRKQIKEEFARRAGRKGELAVLENGAEFTRPGLSIAELDLGNVYRIPESRVPACFRVPAPVAGLAMGVENSDYNNFAEAREAFAEGTVVPLATNWGSAIDAGLRAEGWLTGGLEVEIDCSGMTALQELQRKERAARREDVRAGILTVEEGKGIKTC